VTLSLSVSGTQTYVYRIEQFTIINNNIINIIDDTKNIQVLPAL